MVQLANPHAELPIKNYKYVKNCTELYLAQRGIQKLANFEGFANLEVLWINDNEIEVLDGLHQCFRIKSLHAHNNRIRTLEGSSLVHFKFLEELRLYGNKIKDLQGTLHVLGRLKHLHDLDLFGNPVAEEEGYRYYVIATLPSLRVLDRHVVTEDDREKAARLMARGRDKGDIVRESENQRTKGRPATVPSAPSQQISATVRLLMAEVAATKRQQQQKSIHEAQQELQRLELMRQQTLRSSTLDEGWSNSGSAIPIPLLDIWEFNSLKKHFQRLEATKNSGLCLAQLKQIECHLCGRGFELCNELGHTISIESLTISEPICWSAFVELFKSKRVHCRIMVPSKLRAESASCFEKCQVLQRRLQTGSNSDPSVVEELQHLSQQGYRLQALADSTSSMSTNPPSATKGPIGRETTDQVSSRARFCFTTFAREALSPLATLDHPPGRNQAFLDLKAESTSIDERLSQKYKLRGKDFHKYLMKQTSQPQPVLIRRKFEL